MRAALFLLMVILGSAANGQPVRWPPAPDRSLVEFDRAIPLEDLRLQRGAFGRLVRVVAGQAEDERLRSPFDLCFVGRDLYMTCQGMPALVRIRLDEGDFRLLRCDERPCVEPVALAAWGEQVLMTDSESAVVYRSDGDALRPWIVDGLVRPTGIATDFDARRVYVVDTGEHAIKVFDEEGRLLETLGRRDEGDAGFNYPTFATCDDEGRLFVNDTLNYRVKAFDPSAGTLQSRFGSEGTGPSDFARPKGMAVLDGGRILVADGLLDRLQLFDEEGDCQVVIGGPGSGEGEFWSPNGLAVMGDEIFVADTYNHRIQVLRILDGED